MVKIFYDHLVIQEEITSELDKYELTVLEKEELVELADQTLHHHVLDVILSNLPKEKHQDFLKKFHQNPSNEKLLGYLKEEVADIDKLISEEAKRVKKELLAEIKRSKR